MASLHSSKACSMPSIICFIEQFLKNRPLLKFYRPIIMFSIFSLPVI